MEFKHYSITRSYSHKMRITYQRCLATFVILTTLLKRTGMLLLSLSHKKTVSLSSLFSFESIKLLNSAGSSGGGYMYIEDRLYSDTVSYSVIYCHTQCEVYLKHTSNFNHIIIMNTALHNDYFYVLNFKLDPYTDI